MGSPDFRQLILAVPPAVVPESASSRPQSLPEAQVTISSNRNLDAYIADIHGFDGVRTAISRNNSGIISLARESQNIFTRNSDGVLQSPRHSAEDWFQALYVTFLACYDNQNPQTSEELVSLFIQDVQGVVQDSFTHYANTRSYTDLVYFTNQLSSLVGRFIQMMQARSGQANSGFSEALRRRVENELQSSLRNAYNISARGLQNQSSWNHVRQFYEARALLLTSPSESSMAARVNWLEQVRSRFQQAQRSTQALPEIANGDEDTYSRRLTLNYINADLAALPTPPSGRELAFQMSRLQTTEFILLVASEIDQQHAENVSTVQARYTRVSNELTQLLQNPANQSRNLREVIGLLSSTEGRHLQRLVRDSRTLNAFLDADNHIHSSSGNPESVSQYMNRWAHEIMRTIDSESSVSRNFGAPFTGSEQYLGSFRAILNYFKNDAQGNSSYSNIILTLDAHPSTDAAISTRANTLLNTLSSTSYRATNVASHFFNATNLFFIGGTAALNRTSQALLFRAAGESGTLGRGTFTLIRAGEMTGLGHFTAGTITGIALGLFSSSTQLVSDLRSGRATHFWNDFGTSMIINTAAFGLSALAGRALRSANGQNPSLIRQLFIQSTVGTVGMIGTNALFRVGHNWSRPASEQVPLWDGEEVALTFLNMAAMNMAERPMMSVAINRQLGAYRVGQIETLVNEYIRHCPFGMSPETAATHRTRLTNTLSLLTLRGFSLNSLNARETRAQNRSALSALLWNEHAPQNVPFNITSATADEAGSNSTQRVFVNVAEVVPVDPSQPHGNQRVTLRSITGQNLYESSFETVTLEVSNEYCTRNGIRPNARVILTPRITSGSATDTVVDAVQSPEQRKNNTGMRLDPYRAAPNENPQTTEGGSTTTPSRPRTTVRPPIRPVNSATGSTRPSPDETPAEGTAIPLQNGRTSTARPQVAPSSPQNPRIRLQNILAQLLVGFTPETGPQHNETIINEGNVAGFSHMGIGYSTENQDRMLHHRFRDGSTALVAIDGMGGTGNGQAAAAIARGVLQRAMQNENSNMQELLALAHMAVATYNSQNRAQLPSGAVIMIAHTTPAENGTFQTHFYSVGDAEALVIRQGRVAFSARPARQTTISELDSNGSAETGDQANDTLIERAAPLAHIVQHALGRSFSIRNWSVETQPNDQIILVTDGAFQNSASNQEYADVYRQLSTQGPVTANSLMWALSQETLMRMAILTRQRQNPSQPLQVTRQVIIEAYQQVHRSSPSPQSLARWMNRFGDLWLDASGDLATRIDRNSQLVPASGEVMNPHHNPADPESPRTFNIPDPQYLRGHFKLDNFTILIHQVEAPVCREEITNPDITPVTGLSPMDAHDTDHTTHPSGETTITLDGISVPFFDLKRSLSQSLSGNGIPMWAVCTISRDANGLVRLDSVMHTSRPTGPLNDNQFLVEITPSQEEGSAPQIRAVELGEITSRHDMAAIYRVFDVDSERTNQMPQGLMIEIARIKNLSHNIYDTLESAEYARRPRSGMLVIYSNPDSIQNPNPFSFSSTFVDSTRRLRVDPARRIIARVGISERQDPQISFEPHALTEQQNIIRDAVLDALQNIRASSSSSSR